MRARDWYASSLRVIARDIEDDYPDAAERLRIIAASIKSLPGRNLDQDVFICNCGAIVPGTHSDVAAHLLTHQGDPNA